MEQSTKLESYRIETLVKHLQSTCFNRCVPDLKTSEMTPAEAKCVDRCSWKFLSCHRIVATGMEVAGAPTSAGVAGHTAAKKRKR